MRILDPKTQTILQGIKAILVDANNLLKDLGAEKKDIDLIKEILIQIDDLFMIVIAGEYNAGKSAFINALLGDSYLKTGITPTTSQIHVLRYGEKRETQKLQPGLTNEMIPADLLREVTVIDTPGTNAVLREHEILTNEFIPRSDLVFFVTSVDRPFSESEKMFLEKIRDWGKKIVFIINKIDILDSEGSLQEASDYIASNGKDLLGITPLIFAISAKKSLEYKHQHARSDDQLKKIEDFLTATLGSNQSLALKLSSPLGVAENLIQKYRKVIQDRKEILSADIQLLDDIHKQLSLFREDMLTQYRFRYAEIDNALLEFEKRGLDYFENTFRLARIMDLLNKERIQSEYQNYVIKSLNLEVDKGINQIIDWLVSEDLKQWQVIINKIDERSFQYQGRILDDQGSRMIKIERQKVIDSVNRQAQSAIEQFNKEDEAKRIAEEAQISVATSAAIEVGALGLGALVTLLATTASADVTGILLAGVTATLGLLIIPAKKKNIKSVFSKKISDIRKQLSQTLLKEIEVQIDKVVNHILETVSPYSRFIQSEVGRLDDAHTHTEEILAKSFSSRQDIIKSFGEII